jgi:hypothetical protein
MEEKRDGFFFYRSFYEAIQLVPDESKLNMYQALGEYAILGKEPQINGWELALFTTWKINVDKANSRREASIQNGSKGGRPTKSDIKPKKNQIEPEENLKTISKYLEKNNFQLEKPEVNLNNNINQKENDEFVESGTKQLEFKKDDSQDLFTGIIGEDKIKENDQKFQFEKKFNKLKMENPLLPFEEIMKELLMKYNEIFNNLNLQKLQISPFANWKSYEKLVKSNTNPIIIFYELIKGLQFVLPREDKRNCYYIEPI